MNFQKCSNDFESLVYRIRSNPTMVHPAFSSFSSRFKTFKLFPSNTSQNKYTLSECGLKYSGVDDVVECFCCGLILYNWERLDDPWIEHCRFSPSCLYVLLMKGNQYVQNILSKYCKTEHICKLQNWVIQYRLLIMFLLYIIVNKNKYWFFLKQLICVNIWFNISWSYSKYIRIDS